MNRTISILMKVYVSWAAILTIAYFGLLYSHHDTALPFVWLTIGLSSIVAIIIGIRLNRPQALFGWLALGMANTLFISGDTYFKVLHYLLHIENPFPSYADLLYLITYPLFALGLAILIRKRSTANADRGAVLDAMTFTAGMALLVWVYLVIPNAKADASLLARITSIAYPIGDLLVWAMLMRLMMIDVRTRAVQLLAIGAVGLIFADLIYGLGQFYGFWQEGNPVDLGWILFYFSWGAAALHPSMKELDRPLSQPTPIRLRRLLLLAVTALIAPTVLFIETLRGNADKVAGVVAVFAAILFILVVLRMFTLVREISRRDAEIALDKEKNALMRLISHQLRTPLTIIGWNSEELLNGGQADLAQYARPIQAANYRLVELVNTLIYSSQLDLGTVHFSPVPQSLIELIKSVLVDSKGLLRDRKVTAVFDKTTSDRPVLADPEALKAALSYVVSNAIRYSGAKDARIEISIKYETDVAVISVLDNGVGIPEEDQSHVFTKLYRASNANTSFPDGLGLGLYLAKGVIDRHGGRIWFTSKQGQGSDFFISLPLSL